MHCRAVCLHATERGRHRSRTNTGDTEENAKYLKVMDAIQNGWYQLVFCERWRQELDSGKQDKFHTIYLEWAEFFLEDGSSSPAVDIKAGFTGM